jgi:hypothetical protein
MHNIDVFAPSPQFFWQKFNLITVSVHGTLLYFISGDTCGFSALLSASDHCNQFIIFNLSLNEKYTDQACSCSFLSKDNISLPNISVE